MIIAFDFDKVLSEPIIQRLAIKLRKEKNEIWIVTARNEKEFNKNVLKPVLHKLFLTEYNVIFCNDKPKWELLKGINADIYIDNITDEFQSLLEHTNVVPLLFKQI